MDGSKDRRFSRTTCVVSGAKRVAHAEVMQMEKSDRSASDPFCIELAISVNDRVDVREVCRAIEYLGGIPAGKEFAFSSAQRRDEALKLLCDKYGTRYFAAVDAEAKGGQAEGNS